MGFFSKESLIQALAGGACFSIIQTLVLLVLGSLLVANVHYHQLLSYDIKNAGGGLIFVAMMYLVAAGLGYCSARTLNKFLMLLTVLLLAGLIFFQLLFGSIAVGRAATSFSHELQVACLTVGGYEQMPLSYQEQCEAFFRSDAFAGLALVWQSYYTRSIADGGYRAMVLNFQKENFCCGNALPIHCVNDTRPFPSLHPAPVLTGAVQRRQCEPRGSFFYAATKECMTNQRCEYDLPYGACAANPVTSASRGCGAFVFRKLTREVAAIGTAALALLLVPIVFLLGTLCLCLKRRDEDVRPPVSFVPKVKVHIDG